MFKRCNKIYRLWNYPNNTAIDIFGFPMDITQTDYEANDFVTIEHIYPRSKGGVNNSTNIMLLSRIANGLKSDLIRGCINGIKYYVKRYKTDEPGRYFGKLYTKRIDGATDEMLNQKYTNHINLTSPAQPPQLPHTPKKINIPKRIMVSLYTKKKYQPFKYEKFEDDNSPIYDQSLTFQYSMDEKNNFTTFYNQAINVIKNIYQVELTNIFNPLFILKWLNYRKLISADNYNFFHFLIKFNTLLNKDSVLTVDIDELINEYNQLSITYGLTLDKDNYFDISHIDWTSIIRSTLSVVNMKNSMDMNELINK